MWPDDSKKTVSRETIYNAIYLHPRGELKRELIACLRQLNQVRRPRGRGVDRRGRIKNMQSIHIRPPEIEDRLIPDHWEGDRTRRSNPSIYFFGVPESAHFRLYLAVSKNGSK